MDQLEGEFVHNTTLIIQKQAQVKIRDNRITHYN